MQKKIFKESLKKKVINIKINDFSFTKKRHVISYEPNFKYYHYGGSSNVVWSKLVLGGDSLLTPEEFIGYILIFSQIIPPAKIIYYCILQITKRTASA